MHYLLHHGTLHMIELARLCEITPPAMTRLLDRLEKKRLCQRLRVASDRRVCDVVLTDRGRSVAQGLTPLVVQVQNELLSGFSEPEFRHLRALLERVVANAKTSPGG